MRIQEISVQNLFGMFDHVIPMNMEERITIIHGPNGVGKTILLKMLNRLFNLQYDFLYTIPFAEFRLDFDNQTYLIIKKSFEDKNYTQERLEFSYYNQNQELERYSHQDFEAEELRVEAIKIINDRIVKSIILEEQKYPELQFVQRLGRAVRSIREQREDGWLLELIKNLEVSLIESDRLFDFSDDHSPYRQKDRVYSVTTYSNELAEKIEETLAEYGVLSQSLDRTFPVRVFNPNSSSDLTAETLREQLTELEEQRTQLISLGLLEQDENPEFQVEQEIDDQTKSILSVYVEDVEKKLEVFNEIASKIAIFKKIIENRFSYKKMSITKEEGFTFTTLNDNPLSSTNLSSGEQHELVILYELLFKVKPNSLILIDEPEISLHVAWQVEFLNDLQEIIRLANFDILIATHSPDIINDRWDLTVELQGPNE